MPQKPDNDAARFMRQHRAVRGDHPDRLVLAQPPPFVSGIPTCQECGAEIDAAPWLAARNAADGRALCRACRILDGFRNLPADAPIFVHYDVRDPNLPEDEA